MPTIAGIDPGLEGALVILDGSAVLLAEPMPTDGNGIDARALVAILERHRPTFTLVERASAAPMRGRRQGTTSMFNYGTGYGVLLGVLAALHLDHDTVPPQTWHRHLIGPSHGDPKAAAMAMVRLRLPHLALMRPRCRVPHAGIVDAGAIALYAQSLHRLRIHTKESPC
jgi:hypothetical protein